MVMGYWSVAILFWQLSIDHIVNVQCKRCGLGKTRQRHPSLPFDSLPYPTRTIRRRVSTYREEIQLLSRQEVVEERKQLFRLLSGDAFFPEKSWPKDIRLIFWKKPMGDKETFKLLFFHGNGCNPEIISRWILLAQSWASSQATAEKRARQIQFVNDNVDSKRHQWFYYDLDNL